MNERLPPLQSLYYFQIAAKLGSFKLAAETLFVTAAAVSQQIRQLEDTLGVELFVRQHRKVVLTLEGHLLFQHTDKGFNQLQQGVRQVNQDPRPNQLSISTLPSFAQHWLVPRIGHFRSQNQNQELTIEPTNQLVDFQNSNIDLCIRYGRGDYSNVTSIHLMDELIYPVCHPLYQQQHAIYHLSDLSHADLIEDTWPDFDWSKWLLNVGVTASKPTLQYDGSHFVIEGALAVQGVALAKHTLVQRYIREGKLVRIGQIAQKANYSYYLCAPNGYFRREKIQQFRQWIFSQVEEFETDAKLAGEIFNLE